MLLDPLLDIPSRTISEGGNRMNKQSHELDESSTLCPRKYRPSFQTRKLPLSPFFVILTTWKNIFRHNIRLSPEEHELVLVIGEYILRLSKSQLFCSKW